MEEHQTRKNTALLIIDIQNDFCQESKIKAMVKELENFYQIAKEASIPIFFTKFLSSKNRSPKNMQEFFTKKHGNFSPKCREDTQGANFYKIHPAIEDIVIPKYYYDSFAQTNLNELLKKRKIKNLIITGVRTEICVDATAKRAFSEGYTIFLIKDLIATTSKNQKLHKILLEDAARHYASVITQKEMTKRIKSSEVWQKGGNAYII